jgi:P-type Cu+ transporter
MSTTLLSKAAADDTAASSPTLERITIPISGMTCAACQSFIQRTLADEAGVQDASVNLMLHNATVTFDTSMTSTAGLVEKIRRRDPGPRSIHSGRAGKT